MVEREEKRREKRDESEKGQQGSEGREFESRMEWRIDQIWRELD